MQAVFDFTKCACYMIDVNTFSIEIGRSWGWRRCIVCTLNMFALNIHICKCIIIIYTCIYIYIRISLNKLDVLKCYFKTGHFFIFDLPRDPKSASKW